MYIQIKALKDWRIKSKLQLLTVITLFSILSLGLVSNYFFNTSQTLGIMLNGMRIHQNLLQKGVDDLYEFKITKDSLYLQSSGVKLDKANHIIQEIIQLDQDFKTYTDDEIANEWFLSFPEIFHNNADYSNLLINRLRLFRKIKNSEMIESRKLIVESLKSSEEIKAILLKSKGNIDIDLIQQQLSEIQNYYSGISQKLTSLSQKINNSLIWAMALISLFLGALISILAQQISKSISIPVKRIVEKFEQMSSGNYYTPLSIETKDEIGDLAKSFGIIQKDFQNVVDYTHKVANGDLSISLTPKSKEDKLSISLNQMVKTLKDSKTINEETLWLRSGMNQLNESLQGDQNLNEVSNQALVFMTEFLSAELGAIYVYHEDKELLTLSSSVGIPDKNQYKSIRKGHGLIGMAAESKKIKHIKELPEEYFTIFSGTGEIKPNNLIIVPLVFNDRLWAVMELASIRTFTELDIDFIQAVRESITVKIASTIARGQLENLLETTQNQASELQVQQEELRVANEELSEQTKILIENEKKLQVQQEELRVANEELEERSNILEIQKEEIHQKNIKLSQTHEELEGKAKELEQSSQYKTDFLANMSHELRTPLNSLLILSGILAKNKKGNLTQEDIESVEIINKSGKDLLQLINEILDLSKIEAGKMTIQFENVSVKEIAQDILMDFKHQAEKKQVDFSVTISNDFPENIETDSLRLSQIIKNLLSNAFKFTSRGEISVKMEIAKQTQFRRKELKNVEMVAFVVSDSGVGIPENKKEAIFEAFQQADGSTSRKYGGTGLGLSISKELAQMLGGEIHVESEVGKGSTFSLFIPVKPQISTKIAHNTETLPLKEKTIVLPLFIDDDRSIPQAGPIVMLIHPNQQEATSLYYQIHSNSFNAIVASNIEDALILIEAHQPSAIIIGIELLMNDGEAQLKKLRSHSFASQLPLHIVNPVEGIRERELANLPTVKATNLTIAINKIQKQLFTETKKILIVEDNDITRKVIKNLLLPTNAIIEEVSSGTEALAQIKANNYDCIILDLGLPDFSGNELLFKLSQTNIDIPNTIIYTGKELSRDEHRELSKYTNSIILKGLKSDERLMDEVTLFLHHVAAKIPDNPKVKATEIDNSIFKGKKILVVDDEIRNIFALGKILEEKEIEVLEAENGKIAVDILTENQNIDLVLMDIMMPEMDGYQAMNIIRKTPGIENIPIICLTAKAMKEDYQKAISSGANDYLPKPIDENKLFSMLKIWLYN